MEKRIDGEKIYNGKILTLSRDEIETEDGKRAFREVVHHNGGAAIVACREGKILLERQFRYPYGEEIFEIPAGKREGGEEFIRTARRELEEETGLIPLNLKELFRLYPSPGYTDEIIAVFYADRFQKGTVCLDETENLTSFWIGLDEAYAMIKEGRIRDGKTVAGILYLKAEGIDG